MKMHGRCPYHLVVPRAYHGLHLNADGSYNICRPEPQPAFEHDPIPALRGLRKDVWNEHGCREKFVREMREQCYERACTTAFSSALLMWRFVSRRDQYLRNFQRHPRSAEIVSNEDKLIARRFQSAFIRIYRRPIFFVWLRLCRARFICGYESIPPMSMTCS